MKIYAQIITNRVDLIGGEEVGLPLPKYYLDEHPEVLNIDITEITPKPQVGWHYFDGQFYEADPRPEPAPPPPAPPTPSNVEVIQALNDLRAELEIAGVIL